MPTNWVSEGDATGGGVTAPPTGGAAMGCAFSAEDARSGGVDRSTVAAAVWGVTSVPGSAEEEDKATASGGGDSFGFTSLVGTSSPWAGPGCGVVLVEG